MLKEETLDTLVPLCSADGREVRIYPDYPIGGKQTADALVVLDGNVLVFQNAGRVGNLTAAQRRTLAAASEAVSTQQYLVQDDWHSYTHFNQTPHWGLIEVWGNTAGVEYQSAYDPVDEIALAQLLWKSELRQLLEKLGVHSVPDNVSKAELMYALSRLPQKKRNEIPSHVETALLSRDYEAIGRPDYTYRVPADNIERLMGWTLPADRSMYRHPDGWKSQLYDDPENRVEDVMDRSKPSTRKAITERVKDLSDMWSKRGVHLDRKQNTLLKDMIAAEIAGVPEPVRNPGYVAPNTEIVLPADTVEHKVKWQDIRAVPGSPWISDKIISDFARFLAGGVYGERRKTSQDGVFHSVTTGKWTVQYSHPASWTVTDYSRLESAFGVPGYNGLRILESMLNLRQPKLSSDDKTLAVLEKQDFIQDIFEKWLWRDPMRTWEVEESYNKVFSTFDVKAADGSSLKFPGMSDEVELFPYQKDAVAKILSDRNTLLAFDTGAGKTYIMIAAAMKLRQMKKSRKNMFVVPNNIVGQWEEIFKRMYPDAKLIVVDPAHFKPAMRAEMLERMQHEDTDGIIIAYSCLEQIPLSTKWIHDEIYAQQAEIEDEMDSMRIDELSSLETQMSKTEDAIASELGKLHKLAHKASPDLPTFDELGVTAIFLDEAHNFKNVPVRTALGTVGGLNTSGSVKCLAMLNKVRAVQKSKKGYGAVLATATPLSNSLADAFVMQQYVQPSQLKATQLHTFDNWVKTFAKPEMVCEIDVDTSRFRYVKRLARFFNIPELSKMFSSTAAFYAMNEEDLPELQGYTNILIDRGSGLAKYMQQLCTRTERIREHLVPRTVDNMLKVSTEGRLAALDLRLVGKEQPYNEHSKIHACVESVMNIYNKYEGSTQIVFCDYSTPKADEFNVYDDLKKHLMAAGVPREEIAFIHTFTTEAKKLELYRKVNAGEVRVLIGSTFKLGIGTNVQTKLKAIHHLDIPWRPADMVQREGRILRKGNTNARVQICRYISEGSFDAYSWQILERKQRFIAQFLSGSAYERSASDLEDTVLTYAQVKALAISEPLMKDLAEKENALRRLRMLASNYVQTNTERQESVEKQEMELDALKKEADQAADNAKFVKTLNEDNFTEAYQLYKDTFDSVLLTGKACLTHEASTILGFDINVPSPEEQSEKHPYITLSRAGGVYRIRLGAKPAGNIRRVFNFIKKIGDEKKRLEKSISTLTAKLQANQKALSSGNPYPAQIEQLQEEVKNLRAKIVERQTVPA